MVEYRLDAGGSLAIAVPDAGIGAEGVRIGSAGASIANAGPIEASGDGAHVASRGTIVLEGTSIGSEAARLRAEALRDVPDVEPKLGLAADGDVHVELSAEASRVYDVVDLMQADPLATASIQSFADADPGTPPTTSTSAGKTGPDPARRFHSSHLVQVDTRTGELHLRLPTPAVRRRHDLAAARAVIERMDLGGDALIEAVGDVQIGTDDPLDGGVAGEPGDRGERKPSEPGGRRARAGGENLGRRRRDRGRGHRECGDRHGYP